MTETYRKKEKISAPNRAETLFFSWAKDHYGLSQDEILALAKKKEEEGRESFPLAILTTAELSSLEAIVKYLREERKFRYAKMAVLLQRKEKTLAVSYSVAKRKLSRRFPERIERDAVRIPFSAIKEDLSVLESICLFLKGSQKNVEIARLLGLDERTVWTALDRAKKKVGNNG